MPSATDSSELDVRGRVLCRLGPVLKVLLTHQLGVVADQCDYRFCARNWVRSVHKHAVLVHCLKEKRVVLRVRLHPRKRAEYIKQGEVRAKGLHHLCFAVEIFVYMDNGVRGVYELHRRRTKLAKYLVDRELVVHEQKALVRHGVI